MGVMTNPIIYDEEHYTKLYKELSESRITIPEDVVSKGFGSIAILFAKIQALRDRVSQIALDVAPLVAKAKIQSDAAKRSFESKLDALLDSDPEILALPSDATKKARANKKLSEEKEKVGEAVATHLMFKTFASSVEGVLSYLNSADKSLTEQSNIFKKMNTSPHQGAYQPVYPPRQFPGQ